MTSLNKVKKNTYYTICGFSQNEDAKIIRRLCDLGLTPGQKIKINQKSLLKKAFLIEVRGYLLSLKSSICECILVENDHDKC